MQLLGTMYEITCLQKQNPTSGDNFMVNNQEMYCEHCKRHTLFMLESDLLWHCDECGNVYGSIPSDWVEEEEFEDYGWSDSGDDEDIDGEDIDVGDMDDEDYDIEDIDVGDIMMCPLCNNLVAVDELVDGYLCPICLEDLSDRLEDDEEF